MEFIRLNNGGCIRADYILAVLTAEARAADSLCAELKPRVIVHFGDGIYNNSIVLSCETAEECEELCQSIMAQIKAANEKVGCRDEQAINERLKYPLIHEWHVALNRHADEWRMAGKKLGEIRFLYEAKKMADEVPRMEMLFRQERENALPQTHQQCSHQAPVPVKDNHLTCCKGVKTRDCPHLLALYRIERCTPADIDVAKAWTCATHIVSTGGDIMNEGFLLSVDDRMFWDNVHSSLAQTLS